MNVSALCCFLTGILMAIVLQRYLVDGHVEHTHQYIANELREKWGVDSVLRDIDHLREDLASMIELTDKGVFTDDELAFYLVRMHDFDESGSLDGIELRVAAEHTLEHVKNTVDVPVEMQLERMIDDVLAIDMNNDGFVDYGEFKNRARNSQYKT